MCVQRFDNLLNFVIYIIYRISLRSLLMLKLKNSLLKNFIIMFFILMTFIE